MKKVLLMLTTILVLPIMVNAKEYKNVKINDGTIYSEGDVIKDIQGLPLQSFENDRIERKNYNGNIVTFLNDPYTYRAGAVRYHVITGNNNGNIEYKRLGTNANAYALYAKFDTDEVDSLSEYGYSFTVDSTRAGFDRGFVISYNDDCEAGESYKTDGKVRQWELKDYSTVPNYYHTTCTYVGAYLDANDKIRYVANDFSTCYYSKTDDTVMLNLYEVAPKAPVEENTPGTEDDTPTEPEETPTDEEPIENPETGVYDVLSLVFLIAMFATLLYIKVKENNLFKQI